MVEGGGKRLEEKAGIEEKRKEGKDQHRLLRKGQGEERQGARISPTSFGTSGPLGRLSVVVRVDTSAYR